MLENETQCADPHLVETFGPMDPGYTCRTCAYRKGDTAKSHATCANCNPPFSNHSLVETDPTGKSAHQPGAKLDQGKNRLGLVINGFARALEEVGKVGTYGAEKYTDNGWQDVPDGINRYTDAMYRHLIAEAKGEEIDPETNQLHAAQAAWNALARLDKILRRHQPDRRKPDRRQAKPVIPQPTPETRR